MMFLRSVYASEVSKPNSSEVTIANNRYIKLGILLPFQVLSILFSLFLFCNIIGGSFKLVKPIRNHFILVLLTTSFIQVSIELSMVENYLHVGTVRPSTNSYCLFFNWFEFSLNGTSLFVMLWASVERHILIFSRSTFHSQYKSIVFHYVPLTTAILYTPLCYAYLIFIYDCTNNWNYNELLCTAPCFYQNKFTGSVDWLVNIILPAFSIALANILLIVRVTCRTGDMRANVRRARKNRKMTIQLLAISSLFLVFWLPIALTGLIQQFFSPTFLIDVQFNVFFYLIYFIQLLVPFVCFISLPELKKQMLAMVGRWRGRNVVGDATTLQMSPTVRA